MKRIGVVGAVLAIFLLFQGGVTRAQSMTSAQVQAQIASLIAEVQSLEQQLAAIQGGNGIAWCYTFNTNLSIGMSGPAVTALQTALQKDGESVTVTGAFDDQTAAAVTGFQEKYASHILAPEGLTNGTGYAGMATRAELNALYGCSAAMPTSTGGTPTPVSMPPTPISVPPIIPASTSVSTSISSAQAAPSIISGGGYDPTTGAYSNAITPGNDLVLYGNFSSATNTVSVGGVVLPATGVQGTPGQVTYLEVSIPADIQFVSFGNSTDSTVPVFVTNADGTSNTVDLTVTPAATSPAPPPPSPAAYATPSSIPFAAQQGGPSPAQQTVTVYNLTSGNGMAITPTYVSEPQSVNWLSITPTSNSLGTTRSFNVGTTATADLAPGTYTAFLSVSGVFPGSPVTIPVTMTISPTTNPATFQITSPNGGETWPAGSTQQVTWASTGYPATSPVEVLVYDTRYGVSDNVLDLSEILTTVGAGSFSITIPSSSPAGSYYKVELQVVTSPLGSPTSVSNAPFTITAAPTAQAAPTLSISSDAGTLPTGQLDTGASQVPVFAFDLWNSATENVNITSIALDLSVASSTAPAIFSGASVSDETDASGIYPAPAFASNGAGLYTTTINFNTPLVLPADSHNTYAVAVNVPPYVSNPSIVGTSGKLSVPTGGVTAIGATTNMAATVTGSASGNEMTIVRGN